MPSFIIFAQSTADMAWCAEGHSCKCTGINCANQTDEFTLAGLGKDEVFTPRFTYHGFRYVQVEGLVAEPDNDTLVALFIHSDIPKRGNVHFGMDILNRIQSMYEYTQLSNVHFHPTDCPQREKRGWTGDAQVTAGGATLNFDTSSFYAQWLQTFADHQLVNCAKANKQPTFPQANKDICCDPPNNGKLVKSFKGEECVSHCDMIPFLV